MQYIRELAEYNGNGRAAVTFGKFDGLHRGHQMLVTKVRELGKQENINSIVCSFDMRPLWKEKGIAPELLMVGEERQERVKDEVDYLIECPFTESFRQKSAEDFIQEIIHDLFRAKYIVVGTDFTFGCEKRGDVHMLAELPPNISVSSFVGYLKGKSTLMIFVRHVNLKYKYGNRYFGCR